MKLVPLTKNKMKLEDVATGTLFSYEKTIVLKTDYRNENGEIEAYTYGSGKKFWGGTDNASDLNNLLVTPLIFQ